VGIVEELVEIWPNEVCDIIIEVGIREINTDVNIWSIRKDNEEEKNFITLLIHGVENLNTLAIRNKENFKNLV